MAAKYLSDLSDEKVVAPLIAVKLGLQHIFTT